MARLSTAMAITLAVGVSGVAFGQGADRGKAPSRNASQLGAGGPEVGDPLPDLTIYDESGDPFKLSSLKGKYTVLVFGCLT